MINGETIGVGIVTYKRNNLLLKLIGSIPKNVIDFFIVVDDGGDLKSISNDFIDGEIIINETNFGVGKSKNIALKKLLDYGCDHIFLIEDDIFIKDPLVFEKYIEASKVSGIQHFNYSQHGLGNVTPDFYRNPNPNLIVDYKTCKIAFYTHCVGAFSYYSRKCLETVGFIDERYYNACEHVDHTYEIIKAGMHPPYWYFADIDNSWEYLGDEKWTRYNSTISCHPNHNQMMKDADEIFISKHGLHPCQIPRYEINNSLKEIRNKYGQR
jgi:GT2 family glycosyltransferase